MGEIAPEEAYQLIWLQSQQGWELGKLKPQLGLHVQLPACIVLLNHLRSTALRGNTLLRPGHLQHRLVRGKIGQEFQGEQH